MPRRFEVVLFDLGDTLIYFDGDWDAVFTQAKEALLVSLQNHGYLVNRSFLSDFSKRIYIYYQEREIDNLEHSTKKILSDTLTSWGYPCVSDAVLTSVLSDMYIVTQAHWIPEADAIPTLASLELSGYRMGLISNAADDKNTQTLVDKLGGRRYFEVIVSSAAAGIRKPNPKIFHSVLKQMEIDPEDAIMVGDKLNADIVGAQEAGIFAVWITRRASTPSNQELIGIVYPDAVINTLAELPALLEKLTLEIDEDKRFS